MALGYTTFSRRDEILTIYDIAKLAGVSASTVSRVVNGKPGVKPKTVNKVRKLLDQYEFQLNVNAQSLSTKVTQMVGLLIADVRNAHYTELAYAVETHLLRSGYCTIIVNSGEETDGMKSSIQMLRQRKVDGVIMIGSIFQNDVVSQAITHFLSDVPVVIANGYLDKENVYGVLADEYQGVQKCVELLYERRYCHVAFIGKKNTVSNRQKAEGYKNAVISRGEPLREIELHSSTLMEVDYQPLKELLRLYPETDAIIFSNDYLACEATGFFGARQIAVPEQMGLVGINNDRYCNISCPQITTLDNKMAEMGLMVATTLVDVLNGKPKAKRVMILSEIIERQSIRKEVRI